jgi:hypothetical protein
MEAALAPKGEAGPSDRLVQTLDFPTLAARVASGGGGVFLQSKPSDAEIARRAARAAGTGKIFLVVPEESFHPDLARVPGFRRLLPPRFHEVEARRFPGLGIFPITVHVLQG